MSSKSLFAVISVTFSIIFFTTENVQAITECEMGLRAFGYNGYLDHDTQYFDVGSELKSNPWLPRYRVFVEYVSHKMFSTNSNLMEIHCNNVELLFEEGYTGMLQVDRLRTENKYNQEVVTAYLRFINFLPYSGYDTNEKQFVFDLVYEFAVKNKFITTNKGGNCKIALSIVGFEGNLLKDVKESVKNGGIFSTSMLIDEEYKYVSKYNSFIEYAKTYVLFSDIDSVNVFCNLLVPLATHGFDGTMKNDLHKIEELKMKEKHVVKEEAKIYQNFLERVREDVYIKADIPLPPSYLVQLGIHKLGKIMY